jgi:ring-1,2-phenylacetyl-CoA epoxidase subunit PaaA
MAVQGSLGVSEQQYHGDYRAHLGKSNFEDPENLPGEYKDLLVRMLSIQARIELEYMLVPERTLMRPMGLAPHPEDKVEYAAFWAEEVRHASYWWKILEGLGIKINQEFMSTPLPIYLFEMRDLSEDWVEYAYFSFFGDRQGAYMGFEWVGCTYTPLAKIAERVWREEIGHAAFGYTLLRRACQTPEGRTAAEHYLPKWYAAGLDMFGSDSSKRQYDYIKWGLRKRSNKQMRDDFIVEVNDLLNKVGLPIPDVTAGRKYL